ncbi:glutathione S-transferase family protein [Massilia solisilvae]|uniref:Glutathione S-transferase family protein n=1 Tax=Massilia solisilvae TaxID=1811225 RepID=A0ABT2BPV0_9BURK|nr:glutathione S-transferase family protein [Massilia solisilvae]MCS0610426.1 glutathione S-transferase family protein [Massilia solisilvae]
MYTLTTFRSVPSFAIGFVRDLRVRWALEETGQPYQLRLIEFDERRSPAYRQQQPFGQVPMLDDDGLSLFESGAILLHLGEKAHGLLPAAPAARAQAHAWMFAALSTVEPHVLNLVSLLVFSAEEAWAKERRPALEESLGQRLHDLDAWLEGRQYLAGDFSAADILMATVLRLLGATDHVARFPHLKAYQERCTARPAFKKALADQLALYAPKAANA